MANMDQQYLRREILANEVVLLASWDGENTMYIKLIDTKYFGRDSEIELAPRLVFSVDGMDKAINALVEVLNG